MVNPHANDSWSVFGGAPAEIGMCRLTAHAPLDVVGSGTLARDRRGPDDEPTTGGAQRIGDVTIRRRTDHLTSRTCQALG